MHDDAPEEPGAAALAASGLLDARDPAPSCRRELIAWLRLHAALHLEPQRAAEALQRAGGRPLDALRISGRHEALSRAELERQIAHLARDGLLALPVTGGLYPDSLRALADPPPLLLLRGDARLLARPAIAIVGARAATAYGLGVARALGEALASHGLVVVSGLARGIDAAAHRGALAAGGPTLAVLGCGLDRTYPPEHRALAGEIAERGLLLGELPLGSPPRRAFFPLRNRLISGLSLGVVVVEARERSGSLISARHAANQGREVLAVPGPINVPTSAGPNRLIREGAVPVLEIGDVLDAVGQGGAEATIAGSGAEPPDAAEGTGALDSEARALLAALAHEPLHRDVLARRLGRRPEQLALCVLGLELDGRVCEDRDGRLRLSGRGALRPERRSE